MKRFLSLMLILCLMVTGMVVLSACKDDGKKPYSVVGKTFASSSECLIKWNSNIAEPEKQAIMADKGALNEEEFKQVLAADFESFYGDANIKFAYLEDGAMKIHIGENEYDAYYSQSSDLKTVSNFEDAEKMYQFDEEFSGLEYYKNKYCLPFATEEYVIYIIFNKV